MFKRLLLYVLSGAVLGDIAATLVIPGYLTWNNTPGSGQALCNCPELVKETAASLIRGQLIGAAMGSVAFLVLGIVLERARANRGSSSAVTPPTP